VRACRCCHCTRRRLLVACSGNREQVRLVEADVRERRANERRWQRSYRAAKAAVA